LARSKTLTDLSGQLKEEADASPDAAKVRLLAGTLRDLASETQ
jgi:hypothetical protein